MYVHLLYAFPIIFLKYEFWPVKINRVSSLCELVEVYISCLIFQAYDDLMKAFSERNKVLNCCAHYSLFLYLSG